MKNTLFILFALSAAFALGFYSKTFSSKQLEATTNTQQHNTIIQPKKVTGVGGIFFKCKDPHKVKEWYKTHLGFNTDAYGARFEWQEGCDTTKKASIQWSPFPETETYFNPSTKEFMINYTVENLVTLVAQLKKEGVTMVDTVETYDYGKFVHIMDIEGNKIELFEPNYNFHPAKK